MKSSANTPEKIFSQWSQRAEAALEQWQTVPLSIRWTVRGDGGGSWLIDASSRPVIRPDAGTAAAQCCIDISTEDFTSLLNGDLNPQTAFLSGSLRVAGTLEAALHCNHIFEFLLAEEQGP